MAAIHDGLVNHAKSTRMRSTRARQSLGRPLRFEAMALRHRRGPPVEARLRCRWEPMFELDPGRVKRPRVEVLDIVERLRQKFRGDW
jgi:hypothetical protein